MGETDLPTTKRTTAAQLTTVRGGPPILEPLKPGSYVFNIGLVERKKSLCVSNEIYGKVESARASGVWPLVPI